MKNEDKKQKDKKIECQNHKNSKLLKMHKIGKENLLTILKIKTPFYDL